MHAEDVAQRQQKQALQALFCNFPASLHVHVTFHYTTASVPILQVTSGKDLYLLLATRDNIVLSILGVRLHLNALLATRGCHGEGPYFGAMIFANLLLLSIEPHTLAYQVSTALTPDIEGHLKPAGQRDKHKSWTLA